MTSEGTKARHSEVVDLFSIPMLVTPPFHPPVAELAYLQGLPTVPNRGGGRVSEDTEILRSPALARTAGFVDDQLEIFAREVAGLSADTRLVVTQSWLNLAGPGARHHTHRHPNSIVSGVLYLQGDPAPTRIFREAGASMFGAMEPRLEVINRFNRGVVDVENAASRLILFPSNLLHEVAEYPGTATRMTIAFNTFFVGRLGRNRKLTALDVHAGAA
ncbi:MAG: hypothetical protein IPO08_05175 [Xanthomonadales bacterium]|nr:hypothetical protein [Xanthomonadales bacterium]